MVQTVNFDSTAIQRAIDAILSGMCKRVDIGNGMTVYLVKNVVRVDLKINDPDQ